MFAHKAIVARRCLKLKKLMDSHRTKPEVLTVCIFPDFKISVMKKLLELMYTGTTLLESISELSDLDDLSRLLTGYPVKKWNVSFDNGFSAGNNFDNQLYDDSIASSLSDTMFEPFVEVSVSQWGNSKAVDDSVSVKDFSLGEKRKAMSADASPDFHKKLKTEEVQQSESVASTEAPTAAIQICDVWSTSFGHHLVITHTNYLLNPQFTSSLSALLYLFSPLEVVQMKQPSKIQFNLERIKDNFLLNNVYIHFNGS